MKKLPLGVQSFRKIIEENCVYADKTEYVYNLLNGSDYVFLSRPRRFGKSLLLDTVAEALLGNKELFKGLWIYDSDYEFKKHPVIRLDMSRVANKTSEILEDSLMAKVSSYYEAEGLELKDKIASDAFANLIIRLHQKYETRVAILIDEYDMPLLDHLTTPDTADENRKVLKGFYGVLKSLDGHLRFTMITGVSKFTKTSIFSGMNNLADITMDKEYANVCGIPIEDLEKYFGEHIEKLKPLKAFENVGDLHDEILAWYDGYSWDGETRVINPFSLLCFFQKKEFGSFWYASGSPKFLIDLIKQRPGSFLELKNLEIIEDVLDVCDIREMEIEPLLFQTGYLTITGIEYDEGVPIYALDMPNREVRNAFSLHVLAGLTESGDTFAGRAQRDIKRALKNGDLEQMLSVLRRLFASIPYEIHVKKEAYYHSIFYAVMMVLGFDMDAEVSVSGGRIDATLELDDKVYVMEFKYEDCPKDASDADKQALFDKALTEGMEQIEAKGYHQKYQGSGKEIHLAAFAFLGRDEIEMRAG